MKRIITRADGTVERRNAGLLNPSPTASILAYKQPWDTRRGTVQADRESYLATVTSAIARDLGDVTRFETRAVALGTEEDITERSPYAYALNVSPCAQLTASAFWQSYALNMLYAGESYTLEVNGTLTPLVGGTVEVLIPARGALNPDGSPMLIAGFRVRNGGGLNVGEYGPNGVATGAGAIPGSRLHRTWLPHPESPLRANPPLAAASLPTEVLHTLRQATRSILVNDGMPAGILTVTDPTVDDESITNLETRLNSRLSDPNRKGRTLVVDASVAYQSLGNTVLDGDWVQVAQSFRDELLAVFRTPPSVLGQVGGMTYENQNVAARSYRTQVLMPLRQMLLDTLNQVARTVGYTLTTEVIEGSDLDELQRAEQELKSAQRATAVAQLGIATVNELREMNGLPPIPGGDEPPTQANRQLSAVEAVQKLYLGVGKVITVAEARDMLRQSGAELSDASAEDVFGDLPPSPSQELLREAPPFEVRATSPRLNADEYSAGFDRVADAAEEQLAEFAQAFHARLYRNIVGAMRRKAQARAVEDELPLLTADDLLDVAARTRELAEDLPGLLAAVSQVTVEFVADAVGGEAVTVAADPRWEGILKDRVGRLVEGITEDGKVVYRGWVSEIHDDLTDALAKAYEAGESVDGAAARIADVLDVDPGNPRAAGGRAMRIARTETIGLMNESAREQMQVSGVVSAKEWYTVNDNRTRSSHSALAGVRVPFDGTFNVNGFDASGPHDRGLPASEVVNCRCRLIPVV